MMYAGVFGTVMNVKLDHYSFSCNTIKWYYLFAVCACLFIELPAAE
jgi:hypothetical protein